jgi:hypothetical protein
MPWSVGCSEARPAVRSIKRTPSWEISQSCSHMVDMAPASYAFPTTYGSPVILDATATNMQQWRRDRLSLLLRLSLFWATA